MSKTVEVSKTIKERIELRPGLTSWLGETKQLFNEIVLFYFDVYQNNLELLGLGTKDALTYAERLTHRTKNNPDPLVPLDETIEANIPAMFRRAAINTARGAFKSFHSNLERYNKDKEAFHARMLLKKKPDAKYSKRPPVPPRRFNFNPSFYAGMSKDRTGDSITVKLWSGTSWQWVKIGLRCNLDDDWQMGSPIIVRRRGKYWLHTPATKKIIKPLKIVEQVEQTEDMRICSIDLNLDGCAAVCTILDNDGTPVNSTFIHRAKGLDGRRKRLLGRIATKRSETGVIAEDEQDNARSWQKIRDMDDNEAHRVSRRIVDFATDNGATVIVFEHLQNLRPAKGRYSVKSNAKRMYWLKGRIVDFTKYKAWHEGIITSRVSPKDTSRLCHCCKSEVARYNGGELPIGYTPGTSLYLCHSCFARGSADHNAAINVGHKFWNRYYPGQFWPTSEKPQRPTFNYIDISNLSMDVDFSDTSKDEGGFPAQDAETQGNEVWSALPLFSQIPLRPVGRGYATITDSTAYDGETEAAPLQRQRSVTKEALTV